MTFLSLENKRSKLCTLFIVTILSRTLGEFRPLSLSGRVIGLVQIRFMFKHILPNSEITEVSYLIDVALVSFLRLRVHRFTI